MSVQDANSAGSIHGGTVLRFIDEAAGLAAIKHCGMRVVTAGLDRMTFLEPVAVAELLSCTATVNAAWRSSMEVGVRVEAENPFTRERRHTSTAYLTMVAIDDDGHPARVPPLLTSSRTRSAAATRPSCAAPTGSPSAIRSSATGPRPATPSRAGGPLRRLSRPARGSG